MLTQGHIHCGNSRTFSFFSPGSASASLERAERTHWYCKEAPDRRRVSTHAKPHVRYICIFACLWCASHKRDKGGRKTERLCHLRSTLTNRGDGRCARTLVPGHTAAACPGLMKSGFRWMTNAYRNMHKNTHRPLLLQCYHIDLRACVYAVWYVSSCVCIPYVMAGVLCVENQACTVLYALCV